MPRLPARFRAAWPALGLFFLAPLIAEFLLGNLPITFLFALVLLAPLYGGSAVLTREIARRTGRGWPTMLLLALAYAVLEEGITTMSLFNPNYAGLRLLDNGFIPLLGIAGPWTVRVLTLHVVWSISVPIALMEVLAAPRQTTPWLGRLGLGVYAVLFVFGVIANTIVSVATMHFIATIPQLVATAGLVAALVGAAVLLGSHQQPLTLASKRAPHPLLIGLAAFVATGLYKLLPDDWSPVPIVSLVLAFDILAIAAVVYVSRLAGWSDAHRLALAGGAVLTYSWHGFPQTPMVPVNPTVDLIGNAVFACGAIALLAVAAARLRHLPMTDDMPARPSPKALGVDS